MCVFRSFLLKSVAPPKEVDGSQKKKCTRTCKVSEQRLQLPGLLPEALLCPPSAVPWEPRRGRKRRGSPPPAQGPGQQSEIQPGQAIMTKQRRWRVHAVTTWLAPRAARRAGCPNPQVSNPAERGGGGARFPPQKCTPEFLIGAVEVMSDTNAHFGSILTHPRRRDEGTTANTRGQRFAGLLGSPRLRDQDSRPLGRPPWCLRVPVRAVSQKKNNSPPFSRTTGLWKKILKKSVGAQTPS